jgi:hypothetical protein
MVDEANFRSSDARCLCQSVITAGEFNLAVNSSRNWVSKLSTSPRTFSPPG